MELTQENKAKFFGHYHGQEVFNLEGLSKIYTKPLNDIFDGDYILLKPLSSITDEDAIVIGEIINVSNYDYIEVFEDNTSAIKSILTSNKDGHIYGGCVNIYKDGSIYWDYENKDKYDGFELRLLEAYDYLRSKGYALPWMGLSVDEMIEAGWIKLKS